MSDVFFRRGTPLREWQGSQRSMRWASDVEVRTEYGVSLAEFLKRWREMKRWEWQAWIADRKSGGTK